MDVLLEGDSGADQPLTKTLQVRRFVIHLLEAVEFLPVFRVCVLTAQTVEQFQILPVGQLHVLNPGGLGILPDNGFQGLLHLAALGADGIRQVGGRQGEQRPHAQDFGIEPEHFRLVLHLEGDVADVGFCACSRGAGREQVE